MWDHLTELSEVLKLVPWSLALRGVLNQALRYIQKQKNTKFLIYDPRILNRWYRDERKLGGYLPYKEEVNWIHEILHNKRLEIAIDINETEFHLNEGNSLWQSAQFEAFEAYRSAGHASSNSTIVRLNGIREEEHRTLLNLQAAKYRDQGRSNLILDYKGREQFTLRGLLLAEKPNRLPNLNDERLANTIGMATLILYPESDGSPAPYLVRRAKNLSVYPGGLHASSSCAAEWQLKARTFHDMFIKDMFAEIDEEIGLRAEELGELRPVALCREFLRAGKPQLFFITTTGLSRDELRRRRAMAIARSKKFNPEKVELLPDRWWRRSDVISGIGSYAVLRRGMSLEGAAALYYLAELVSASNRVEAD